MRKREGVHHLQKSAVALVTGLLIYQLICMYIYVYRPYTVRHKACRFINMGKVQIANFLKVAIEFKKSVRRVLCTRKRLPVKSCDHRRIGVGGGGRGVGGSATEKQGCSGEYFKHFQN